jgi:hypothetical protein
MTKAKRYVVVALLLPIVNLFVIAAAYLGVLMGEHMGEMQMQLISTASGRELLGAFSVATLITVGIYVALSSKNKNAKERLSNDYQ